MPLPCQAKHCLAEHCPDQPCHALTRLAVPNLALRGRLGLEPGCLPTALLCCPCHARPRPASPRQAEPGRAMPCVGVQDSNLNVCQSPDQTLDQPCPALPSHTLPCRSTPCAIDSIPSSHGIARAIAHNLRSPGDPA